MIKKKEIKTKNQTKNHPKIVVIVMIFLLGINLGNKVFYRHIRIQSMSKTIKHSSVMKVHITSTLYKK